MTAETSATVDGKAAATAPAPVPKNIGEAKLEIMKRVPYLLKRKPGKEERGINYTYAAEPDLIRELRPVMIAFGVDVRPGKVKIENQEQYETKHGGKWNRVRIIQEFIFRHVPSLTEDVCEIVGEGADPGDKTSGKSHTGALKYALRQYFLIETGDDPDRVSSDEQQQMSRPSGFDVAKRTVTTADSIKRLNIFRNAYFQRGYSKSQVQELEGIYWKRAGELGAVIPPEYAGGEGDSHADDRGG